MVAPVPMIAELPAPMIAELPAALPPAPHTTTSDQQLKEDELLAHKIQRLEVEDVRKRSNSALGIRRRPVSFVAQELPGSTPLLQQQSLPPARPHSQSLTLENVPWGPASFSMSANNTWPEVINPSRSISYTTEDFPIPVMSEELSLINTTSLSTDIDVAARSAYLEEHREPLYPAQWTPLPVMATFFAYHGHKKDSGSHWLSQQDTCSWRTIRPTEHAYNPSAPSYTFHFETKGGSFRDPRFTWSMTCPEDAQEAKKKSFKAASKPVWTYELRLDRSKGVRKSEILSHGKEQSVLTTYVHARNYDSLRFIGPDGRAYMWVSSGNVSALKGSRFDTNRHALFASVGQNPDPLYGEIVADHTFWDGYVDENEVHKGAKCDNCQTTPVKGRFYKCKTCHQHDACETCRQQILAGAFGEEMQQACVFSLVCLPNEALNIRSITVDAALIVATLQVLKDWELHTIRMEKKNHPIDFKAGEDATRAYDLGVISHWKASDWEKKKGDNERRGTVVKARSIEEVKGEAKDESPSALVNLVAAGSALSAHGHGSGAGTT